MAWIFLACILDELSNQVARGMMARAIVNLDIAALKKATSLGASTVKKVLISHSLPPAVRAGLQNPGAKAGTLVKVLHTL
jgi:hypothetical protein